MKQGRTRTNMTLNCFVFLLLIMVSRIQSFVMPSFILSQRSTSKQALIPEENPEFDPQAVSLSGVPYNPVLTGLNRIFPPQSLDQRNALSRTDGYWPWIQQGKDPPQHLTYGEFDFYFFAQLLDRARSLFIDQDNNTSTWDGKVFCDIGSGTGRLVMAAAALHPGWKLCRGVELLPTIHEAAQRYAESCVQGTSLALVTSDEETGRQVLLPMAPIKLACGSFEDPYVFFGDADLVFCFSSCMTNSLMESLAKAVARQCKPGTIVITTEFMLPLEGHIAPVTSDDRITSGPYQLELVEKVDGWCWLTGGASTAFIHRVKVSLWKPDSQPLNPPQLTAEDMAYNVAMALEKGEFADSDAFKRGVYNNMMFLDLPESWLPDVSNN